MAKNSGKGSSDGTTPNDQRAMAHNPNSAAYKAAQDNFANQKNPSHPAYTSSRNGQSLPAKPAPRPNDQRSNINNPTDPSYKAAQDNRANQLKPLHPAYKASRGLVDDDDGDGK